MAWTKTANAAMYKGANWEGFIKKVPNCTPEQAKRIAFQNPTITFFFFCREYIILEGPVFEKYGAFNPGDAVFFTGEPWYGDAPQCDSYQKTYTTTVYTSPTDPQQFRNIACYVLADGSPAVDVVCLFGGNYCSDQLPYLRANNNDPVTDKPLNPNLQQVLDDGSVKYLQEKGITVLLTILNGHSTVGWSEFTNETDAEKFASYLKTDFIDKYGLDGIDIDDEYSNGTPNDTSLIMVTSIMKKLMPDKLITKALWSDLEYFESSYQGMTLAEQLDYGWEMSYGGDPQYRLPPYTTVGMAKNAISCGFWEEQDSGNDPANVQWIKTNGYAGIMVFQFETTLNQTLAGQLVNDLFGPGNWKWEV